MGLLGLVFILMLLFMLLPVFLGLVLLAVVEVQKMSFTGWLCR